MNQSNREKIVDFQTICVFSENDQDPCSHIRVLGPMDHLNIQVIKGFKDHVLNLDAIQGCDLVLIQRIFPREFDAYEEVIQKAKDEHKPVIFDIDDLLFSLPEDHPERKDHVYTSAILPMIQAVLEADLVTVSTQKLKDTLINLNKNISVIPNFLDDRLWQLTTPKKKEPDDPVLIGYMGSSSHEPDLRIISTAILYLLDKYPEKIKFHFWGIQPPDNLDQHVQVSWSPSVTYNYREFAEYFQKQTADIWLAPLVDNLFNRCKSGIKYLEYTALGAPGVFSNFEPYNSIINHGQDGFLASSETDWIEYASTLIEDDQLRMKMAMNAQDNVKTRWLLSKNAIEWEAAFQSALQNSLSSQKENIDKNSVIIKAATKQIHEYLFGKQANIPQLEKTIKQRDQRINAMLETIGSHEIEIGKRDRKINVLENALNVSESEIIQYVQSTSWKVTRPLRKISRLLRKLQ